MFNEKSQKWIKIYKKITIVAFWCWIAVGLFAAMDCWWYITGLLNIRGDNDFLVGVLLLLCGLVVGYIQLVTNMAIIQLLSDVRLIRDKLMDDKHTN